MQQRQKWGNLRRDCGNGKAIADCNLKIAFRRATLSNFVPRCAIKMATEIRAQQIFVLASCLRACLKELPLSPEGCAERFLDVEFSSDGVARGCVGFAQIQLRRGAISRPGATHENASGRARANFADNFG